MTNMPRIPLTSPSRRVARAVAAALAAAICLCTLPSGGRAGPAVVFDTRTGEVLHAYGAFTPWHPASLTKLMTAYVTFKAIEAGRISLETPVKMSALANSQPPSKLGYPIGSEISTDLALRILMVKSANDVAVALGETVSGSHDAFIAEMNTTARRIGMVDTFYVNPHGLHDPRQRTTARDLTVLTRALIRDFSKYQPYFELPSVKVGKTVMRNHNKLIGSFRGADGMKTGYVCASGWNIIATATRSGRRIGAVVLGGMNANIRNQVTAQLLEAGFAEGTGFGLFKATRPTIDSLKRPERIGAPIDVRAYVCEKKKAPAEIASFGIGESATAQGGQPSGPAGAMLALAAGPVIDLGPVAEIGKKAVIGVPLPRPRPVELMSAVAAETPAAQPISAQPVSAQPVSTERGEPRPRPNPLR